MTNNQIWYKNTYDSLIQKGLTRGLKKGVLGYYTEKHHILPRCMGGKDVNSNYVLLTAREHIIAHMLLACIYPENPDLIFSVTKMFSIGKTKRLEGIERVSTRLLSIFKEEQSRIQLGKTLTESHKKNLSISHKGIKLSEETKEKLDSTRFKYKIKGPNGEIYESLAECSLKTGIPKSTLLYRVRNKPDLGYTIIDKNKSGKNTKVIGPDGTIYSSIRECAKSLNRNDKTIKQWIENHPELGFSYA